MKISQFWDDAIIPALVDYIRIPAKSPHFDPAWQKNGYIDAAVELAAGWCRRNALAGVKLEVVRLENRTPVLLVEVPAFQTSSAKTVLMYGHLDKQPEMVGWREGYGPWIPRREDGKLYGRGGADDGYAVFCALAALRELRASGAAHARTAILIECCEESGSYDLPAYLELLAPRIGRPSLVVALDSGCGNYEQLWGTTSLRGLVNGVLTVEVLAEGVHSGDASGVVPNPTKTYRVTVNNFMATGGDGWADVWKRGCFGWEYKGKHKDLAEAYDQLLQYREALENPPLLVVCDLNRFEALRLLRNVQGGACRPSEGRVPPRRIDPFRWRRGYPGAPRRRAHSGRRAGSIPGR